ncbi:MAG: acetamidase/formamidase family protein, partial [Gaiellaceae bacterium]
MDALRPVHDLRDVQVGADTGEDEGVAAEDAELAAHERDHSVDGALFSVGDGHGAQGDGEVCITAVEMSARVTLRFGLAKGKRIAEPQFRMPGPVGVRTNTGSRFVTTA